MLTGDRENYRVYADRCAAQYRIRENPVLNAKYRKLVREARTTVSVDDYGGILTAESNDSLLGCPRPEIERMFKQCEGPDARANLALKILVTESNCAGGFLYLIQADNPVLTARYGPYSHTEKIDAVARSSVAAEIEIMDDKTSTLGTQEVSRMNTAWTGLQGEQYCSVVVGHYTSDGFALAGVAVLVSDPEGSYSLSTSALFAISRLLGDAGDVSHFIAD